MLKDTRERYGSVSIGLHWVMALAIFALFGLGLWMRTLDYYDAWYNRAPDLHKSAGMLLLFLLVARLLWRLVNMHPALLGRVWERIAALVVHRAQYVLMLIVMLTGYLIPTAEGKGVSVFGWFVVPALFEFDKHQADVIGFVHKYSAWALVVLAVLHGAAALKHHFVDRDATLTRMLGLNPNISHNTKEETP
jgi:cytochrome b561